MRSARIDVDGVLRDAEGRAYGRSLRSVRPPTGQLPQPVVKPKAFVESRPKPALMGFYSPYLAQAPATAEVGPARMAANKLGVPTAKFSYSTLVGDPSTQVYPSRIVYQAKDDESSVYLVSFRAASDPKKWVKLYKLEGTGAGRWYEVPIYERLADPKTGKIMPALMLDFMVVPAEKVHFVWNYVKPLRPVFEDNTPADTYANTAGIMTAMLTAREAIGDIPYASDISVTNFYDRVLKRASAAQVMALMALDLAAAAFDISAIGRNAYRIYLRLGSDLLKDAIELTDHSLSYLVNPGLDQAFAIEAVKIRSNAKEHIFGLYAARAELYSAWNVAIDHSVKQDVYDDLREVCQDLYDGITNRRSEILAKGAKPQDLDMILEISKEVIDRYDTYNETYLAERDKLLAANEMSVGDLEIAVSFIPAMLEENKKEILAYLGRKTEVPAPQKFGLVTTATLSGLGQPRGLPQAARKKIIDIVGARYTPGPHLRTKAAYRAWFKQMKLEVELLKSALDAILAEKTEKFVMMRTQDAKMYDEALQQIHAREILLREAEKAGEKSKVEQLKAEIEQLKKDHKMNSNERSLAQAFFDLTRPIREAEARGEIGLPDVARNLVRVFLNVEEGVAIIKNFPIKAIERLAKLAATVGKEIPPSVWKELVRGIVLRYDPKGTLTGVLKKIDEKIALHEQKLKTGKIRAEKKVRVLGPSELKKIKEEHSELVRFRDILRGKGRFNIEELEAARIQLEADVKDMQRGIAAGLRPTLSLQAWNRAQRVISMIEEAILPEPIGKGKETRAITHTEEIVLDLLDEKGNRGRNLIADETGRKLRSELEAAVGHLRASLRSAKDALGKDYETFKEEKNSERQAAAAHEVAELEKSAISFHQKFTEAENRAFYPLTRTRIRRGIGKTFDFLLTLFNPLGLPVKIAKEGKEAGPVVSALWAGVSTTLLVFSVTGISKVLALVGVPGAESVYKFFAGLLGIATRAFGGDATVSDEALKVKKEWSAWPLVGIAFAIAMIAYGKPVFEAIGKTLGGFFQFLTALLPGKKKGLPRGLPGARRGPKVNVDQWVDRLEAAKHRLEKAKEANDAAAERAAEKAIEKAIEKLKKAEEEGQAVPTGLWGFNWMG